jgi:hypothetical protein
MQRFSWGYSSPEVLQVRNGTVRLEPTTTTPSMTRNRALLGLIAALLLLAPLLPRQPIPSNTPAPAACALET